VLRSLFSHLSHPNPLTTLTVNLTLTLILTLTNPNLHSNPTLTLTLRSVTKVRKWTSPQFVYSLTTKLKAGVVAAAVWITNLIWLSSDFAPYLKNASTRRVRDSVSIPVRIRVRFGVGLEFVLGLRLLSVIVFRQCGVKTEETHLIYVMLQTYVTHCWWTRVLLYLHHCLSPSS